jgi:hypothetical protein
VFKASVGGLLLVLFETAAVFVGVLGGIECKLAG